MRSAWQRRPEREGWACFAVVKLSDRASIKPVQRFPMTGQGWGQAWSDLLIRNAQHGPSSADDSPPPSPSSVVDQLARLAAMLDSGLLTRQEFDQLKRQLITGGQNEPGQAPL